MRKASRRLPAAFACLAFLLQALVPSFAWAVAAGKSAPLSAQGRYASALAGAICSMHEADAPALAGGADQPRAPEAPLPAAAHCPLCLLPTGGEPAALIPAPVRLAVTGTTAHPLAGTDIATLPVPVRQLPDARAPPAR